MQDDAVHHVATELSAVVEAAASDDHLSTRDMRRVLRFVAKVAHVVEQALQDTYGLAIEVAHVRKGDRDEIYRLRRELDLIRARSEYSKAEEICSRLRHLRAAFEQDVALLLRCSRGHERWQQLFWLLEEREGRIVRLLDESTASMAAQLDELEDAGVFRRSQVSSETHKMAAAAGTAIHTALRELRDIRDRIFGLSGDVGFLALTEEDPLKLRELAHQLNVRIATGDTYRMTVTDATVGALSFGPGASATGSAARSDADHDDP
jgi:hypothetical protein